MGDFTDLVDRVDELENNAQESADNLDQFQGDLQQTLDDISQQQATDEETLGQLAFPLTQETIDLITEQSPAIIKYLFDQNYISTATLVAGTVTVSNPLVSATSLVMLSRSTTGGTLGNLSYTVSAGSLVITSSSATDTSTIIYFILN